MRLIMKVFFVLSLLSQLVFAQSRIIYFDGIKLQLGKDRQVFLNEVNTKKYLVEEISDKTYHIKKEIDNIIYQANVMFVNDKMVSADKTWGVYPIAEAFKALKDYFNLLENQKDYDQLNVFFTQRSTDINQEHFTITNSFGEYRIEIMFNKEYIIVEERLYDANQ